MDPNQVDALARLVGSGQSRRRILKTLFGGALASIGAAVGLRSAAAAKLRSVGNACSANADCASGLCVQESRTRNICHCQSPADCPAAKDGCHAAACLPAGSCGLSVNVGAACDDGNACTTDDVCQANGTCAGTAIGCPAPDQCHNPGTCNPQTGVCSNPPLPNGASCETGDLCTADTCQAGICTAGTATVCTASDQCHSAGTCDPGTGVCSNPLKPDGAACDDGNACTQSDTCQAGVCAGGDPVVCAASDACHDAGVCDHTTGQCTNPLKANGAACNDSNACTQTDTCQNGVCSGSNPVVCAPPSECHQAGVCDTSTGLCSYFLVVDGTPCTGTDLCFQSHACQTGVCIGVTTVVCPPATDQCHSPGTCNPASGACSAQTPVSNGTPCDDGDPNTINDVCTAGVCAGVSRCAGVVCTPQDQCHDAGTCDPSTGQCSNPAKANGTACNDGNACTQTDACQSGVCLGSNPVVCNPQDQCHNEGTCNPSTGLCSNPPKPDGTPCDDGQSCTVGETCQSGVCTPASELATGASCVPPEAVPGVQAFCQADGQCCVPSGSFAGGTPNVSCNAANCCYYQCYVNTSLCL